MGHIFPTDALQDDMVFDSSGIAYVIADDGVLYSIDTAGNASIFATLPIVFGPCDDPPAGSLTPPVEAARGLSIDTSDQLYVGVEACDPAKHGVWRVEGRCRLAVCGRRRGNDLESAPIRRHRRALER